MNGPTPFPFVGTFLILLFKNLRNVKKEHIQPYGKYHGEYMGTTPLFVIADADMAKQVLITNFHIFNQSQKPIPGNEFFKNSLVTMNGPNWKRVRSAISPIFTTGKLRRTGKHLQFPMQNCLNNLNELIREGKDDKVEFKDFAKGYALDVIAKFVFAIEINTYKAQDSAFVSNAFKLVKVRQLPFLLVQLLPESISKHFAESILDKKASNFFTEITKQIIQDRLKNPEVKYKDFVDLLLESSDDLNDDEKITQCVLFFFAGMETVSSSLCVLMSDIAHYQDVQEKLYAEIDEKIGNEVLDYDNVYALEYLDAFVHESLRMTPVAPRLIRHPQSEYVFGDTRMTLEAGKPVMIDVLSIHYDENIYPDPFTFRPERFLKENRSENQYWLPFGDGPRNCVGLRFALLEVKYFLVKMIQNYRIQLADGVKFPIDYQGSIFLMNPKDLRFKYTPRS